MPLPRMTTRRWMIAVAVVGLLLAAPREFARLKRLSRQYEERAINAARRMSHSRMSASWSDERWVAECRAIEETESKWNTGIPMSIGRPLRPDLARARITFWEPIRLKYERAARYPWLPVEPDPPEPE